MTAEPVATRAFSPQLLGRPVRPGAFSPRTAGFPGGIDHQRGRAAADPSTAGERAGAA